MKILENYLAYLGEKKFCGTVIITIEGGLPVKMVQNSVAQPYAQKNPSKKNRYSERPEVNRGR